MEMDEGGRMHEVEPTRSEVADTLNPEALRDQLLTIAMADAHVAESAQLVYAALQVVPVPPALQAQAAGFSTSGN